MNKSLTLLKNQNEEQIQEPGPLEPTNLREPAAHSQDKERIKREKKEEGKIERRAKKKEKEDTQKETGPNTTQAPPHPSSNNPQISNLPMRHHTPERHPISGLYKAPASHNKPKKKSGPPPAIRQKSEDSSSDSARSSTESHRRWDPKCIIKFVRSNSLYRHFAGSSESRRSASYKALIQSMPSCPLIQYWVNVDVSLYGEVLSNQLPPFMGILSAIVISDLYSHLMVLDRGLGLLTQHLRDSLTETWGPERTSHGSRLESLVSSITLKGYFFLPSGLPHKDPLSSQFRRDSKVHPGESFRKLLSYRVSASLREIPHSAEETIKTEGYGQSPAPSKETLQAIKKVIKSQKGRSHFALHTTVHLLESTLK